jgi:hypothetical protein
MKRGLAAAIAAAVLATTLVVGNAFAGHGHGTGGGTFFYLTFERLDFEAHDFGVDSPLDRGTAHYRNLTAGVEYTAKIVCALVTEDVVRFGYVIPENESTTAIGIVGVEVVWEVKDGGSPGEGNDSAAWSAAPPGSGIAEECDTHPVVSTPTSNVLNGNFSVHEAN